MRLPLYICVPVCGVDFVFQAAFKYAQLGHMRIYLIFFVYFVVLH